MKPPPIRTTPLLHTLQALLEWARASGIEWNRALRPASFGGLRGLAATRPLQPDDILVSVPRARAITLAPKQRCPCPDFVSKEYWSAAPW